MLSVRFSVRSAMPSDPCVANYLVPLAPGAGGPALCRMAVGGLGFRAGVDARGSVSFSNVVGRVLVIVFRDCR